MDKEAMKKHGAFSWSELMTHDVRGAKAFYGELLGWSFQKANTTGMDYTMIKVGDREVGGMMTIPEQNSGMPPNWGVYVTVSNVDALLARVEKLGGKIIVPAQDIPSVGRFAVIQDPQGAMLSLITYLSKQV